MNVLKNADGLFKVIDYFEGLYILLLFKFVNPLPEQVRKSFTYNAPFIVVLFDTKMYFLMDLVDLVGQYLWYLHFGKMKL